MKILLAVGFAALGLAAAGGNAVFNPGFELGTDGYAVNWLSNPVKNPNLIFHELRVEQDAPTEGKKFLRFDNPFGEVFELHSREFCLEGGKEYTLSFSARCSTPDTMISAAVFGIMPDRRWLTYNKAFCLSQQWQRHFFSFTPNGSGYYHIVITPAKRHAEKIPCGTIDLDAIEIDNGKPTPTLEIAVASASDLYERERDKSAKLTLKIRNTSRTRISKTLNVCGVDPYFNRLLWKKNFSATLAPGEVKNIPFEAPLDRYGGVRIEVENMPEALAGYYAVIGHYEIRPIDIRRDFCVGINGASNHEERRSFYPGFYARGKSVHDNLSQLSRLGVRLIRERDGGAGMAQWRFLEPEEGKFDFRHADFLLGLYHKYNIEPLPILSEDFIESKGGSIPGWHYRGHMPGWLSAKCTRVKNDPPNVMRAARGRILLPPHDIYRRYVRAFVEHYRGKVQAVELTNEPNLWISPEVYMEYLRIAAPEVHAADPSMMLVGLCLTGDKKCETAMPWSQECIKSGALSLVNAVSFHPYNSRELSSPVPADTYIGALQRVLGTKTMPIWNTELYYCYDLASGDSRDQQTCSADQVSRRFLTDLGEGVTQSICMFTFAPGLWYSTLTPNLNNPEGTMGLHPSPAMVAYNALARYFERARPVAKRRLPRQIICYSFRDRAGNPLAAVWNYGESNGVLLDFGDMEVRDLFGNKVVSAKPLEVTRAPFFLFPGKNTKQEFEKKLNQLQPIVPMPLMISPAARLYGGKVRIGLQNDSNTILSATVGFRGEGWTTVRPERIKLAPGESRTVALPVGEGGGKKQQPEVLINANRRMFRIPVKLYCNSVYRAGEKITLQSKDGILRGTAVICRKENKLAMTFRVEDKTNAGEKGNRYDWETDSIELFLDRKPGEFFCGGDKHYPERYQPETFRLFLLPRESSGKQLVVSGNALRVEDVAIFTTVDAEGYTIRVELPAENCRELGLDIKVNDSESIRTKARRSAKFSPSPVPHLDRFVFNIIHFNQKGDGK